MKREHININDTFSIFPDTLVCQKNPNFKGQKIHLSGDEIDLYRDGCAFVSLYNAVLTHGYAGSVERFIDELSQNGAIDKSVGINWVNFNATDFNLKFVWMQDNEISSCEDVDIRMMKEHMSNFELVPVVKLQSIYGVDRRHCMIAIDSDQRGIKCLESSSVSGKVEERYIEEDDVLGVRYLCTHDSLPMWKNVFSRHERIYEYNT